MELLNNLSWRYATKKMDSSKKVSEDDLTNIKQAIQLSASSYGLQPYKILDIRDSELREKLQPICWGQSQIVEASHLLIFCNRVALKDDDVDDLIRLKAKTNGLDIDQLSGYGDFIKGKLKEKSKEDMFHWTAKQTYIALGNALNACAELKIDSTPMEGFEADQMNELLDLDDQGLNASVLLAIGYRDREDGAQHAGKVRKPLQEIFENI